MMARSRTGLLPACVLVLVAGCKGKAEAPESTGPVSEHATGTEEPGAPEAGAGSRQVFWNQVAGRFYPGEEKELEKMVTAHLKDAGEPPAAVADRDLIGFISPHAGYPYSGPVAGFGFTLLAGRPVSTVVVLGFSHKGVGARSALLDFDAYRTPLGTMTIDRELAGELLERGGDVLVKSQAPFVQEHSLETQLPFIQKAAPRAKILPIMVGHPGGRVDVGLVDLLYSVVGDRKDVVVVASTDLSHYEPYDQAVSKDNETLDRIAALDWDSLEADGPAAGRMCGYYTVGVIMGLAARYADEQVQGHRLKYLNSGDTAGSRDGGVVGYGVVAFTVPAGTRAAEGASAAASSGPALRAPRGSLSPGDRAALLNVATQAAGAAVTGRSFKPAVAGSETLEQMAAALVNIRVDGRSRGTGGTTEAAKPLFEAVAEAAMDAVVGDARYPRPVEKDIETLECEVVVVHKTWPLEDAESHDAAAHGLIVQAEDRIAYVGPGEGGMSSEQALGQACRRVGLAPTCWKKKKQEVVPVFTAFEGERFAEWDDDGKP